MEPELVGWDEVVVIGYGTQKKSDLTVAMDNLTTDDININKKVVASSVDQLMLKRKIMLKQKQAWLYACFVK